MCILFPGTGFPLGRAHSNKCFPLYNMSSLNPSASVHLSFLTLFTFTDVVFYSGVFPTAPTDFTLLSNRSNVFAKIGKFEEALKDADQVIRLRPDWPKVITTVG